MIEDGLLMSLNAIKHLAIFEQFHIEGRMIDILGLTPDVSAVGVAETDRIITALYLKNMSRGPTFGFINDNDGRRGHMLWRSKGLCSFHVFANKERRNTRKQIGQRRNVGVSSEG